MERAGGGALCIYLGGEPVLDIWAGQRDPATGQTWEHDTMAMAWSSTKGVASTALHMLADRRQLVYDDPIATYWPEFAANGKASITVRHLMAMEAGLYDIRHLISDPRDMLDRAKMVALLESAIPRHPPGQSCAYHALTYGWIAGELVKRVTGTSLGAFVSSEIVEPLDLDGCYIGTPPSEIDRVAARPTLKPEATAVRLAARTIEPLTRLAGFSPSRFAAAFLPRGGHEVIPTREFLAAEIPGINGVFTARSLARLYAALGSDEGLDGVALWSPETRRIATEQQNNTRDLVVPLRVGWRLGYHQPYPKKHTSSCAFGFYGAYGSGGFADPDRRLAVGLVLREANGIPLTKLVPRILSARLRR